MKEDIQGSSLRPFLLVCYFTRSFFALFARRGVEEDLEKNPNIKKRKLY